MAAIIGFSSQWSDLSVVLRGCPQEVSILTRYGHLAFEDNYQRVYGFLPDPAPLKIEPHEIYPGRYFDQTDLFALLKGKIRVDRFEFSLDWMEEFFIYQRLQGMETAFYCMHAPLSGPPYNCISYIREVLQVGDLPRTNFIREVFEDMRKKRG